MLSTKLVIYLQRVAIDITQELQIISGVFRNLLRGGYQIQMSIISSMNFLYIHL